MVCGDRTAAGDDDAGGEEAGVSRGAARMFLVGVLVVLAGCGAHVDPNVCGLCNDATATDVVDEDSVGRTAMHVYLTDGGDARVTVSMRLDDRTVQRLRSNPSEYEALATTVARAAVRPLAGARPTPQDVFGGMGGGAPSETPRPVAPASDAEAVNVSLTDDGVVVTYGVEGFARRTVGTLVVDRFVVHAPDGMAVATAVGDAGVETGRTTAAWTRGGITPYTYVVFGPTDSPLSTVRGRLAVAVVNLGWALGLAFVPGLIAFGSLAVALADLRRRRSPADGDTSVSGSDGRGGNQRTSGRFEAPERRASVAVVATAAGLVLVALLAAVAPGPRDPVLLGVVAVTGVAPPVLVLAYLRTRERDGPEPVRYSLATAVLGSGPVFAVAVVLHFGGREVFTGAVAVVLWAMAATVVCALVAWLRTLSL